MDGTKEPFKVFTLETSGLETTIDEMIDERNHWDELNMRPDTIVIGVKQWLALEHLRYQGYRTDEARFMFNGCHIVVIPMPDFCEYSSDRQINNVEMASLWNDLERLNVRKPAESAADGSLSSQIRLDTTMRPRRNGPRPEEYGLTEESLRHTHAPTSASEASAAYTTSAHSHVASTRAPVTAPSPRSRETLTLADLEEIVRDERPLPVEEIMAARLILHEQDIRPGRVMYQEADRGINYIPPDGPTVQVERDAMAYHAGPVYAEALNEVHFNLGAFANPPRLQNPKAGIPIETEEE